MTIKSNNYYVNGPPIGLYDSLITSGLIGSSGDIPIYSKTPQINPDLDNFTTVKPEKTKKTTKKNSIIVSAAITVKEKTKRVNIAKKKDPTTPILHCIPHKRIGTSLTSSPKTFSLGYIDEKNRYSQANSNLNSTIDFDSFPNVMKSDKGHINRKAVIDLYNNFKEKLKDIEKSFDGKELSISEQTDKRDLQLAAYYHLWNDIIFYTKHFDSDLALMSRDVKSFIQDYIKDTPILTKGLENSIEDKEAIINNLNEEKEGMQEVISNQHNEIQSLKENLINTKKESNAFKEKARTMNNKINDYLYKIDEQKGKESEILYKIKNVEEKKRDLEETINNLNHVIQSQQEILADQETKIDQYEKEGALFKPMYDKEVKNNEDLKNEIVDLEKKIVILSTPIKKADAAVQVDINAVPNINATKKRSRRYTIAAKGPITSINTRPPEILQESGRGHKLISSRKGSREHIKTKEEKSLLEEIVEDDNDNNNELSKNEYKRGGKSQEFGSSIKLVNAKSSSSFKLTGSRSNNSFKLISGNKEKISLPKKVLATPPVNKKVESLPINGALTQTMVSFTPKKVKIPKFNSEMDLIEEEDKTNQENAIPGIDHLDFEELPSDYPKKTRFDIPEQAKVFVNSLFPLPIDQQMDHINEKIINPKEGCTMKPFSWTFRQIIYIFKNGINRDSKDITSKGLLETIKKTVSSSTNKKEVVQRITSDFFFSANSFQHNSDAAQFFYAFINGRYSIVDFEFFSTVFNLAYDIVYPSFVNVINDSELSMEIDKFYIHVNHAKKIISFLLRETCLKDAEKEFSNMTHPSYPQLIKFWDFSKLILNLFTSIHQMFHYQVKTVLFITGYSNNCLITEERFSEFMRIVSPFLLEKEVDKLWKALCLTSTNKDDKDITMASFLKFCGYFPEVSKSIFSIQCIKDYQNRIRTTPSPIIHVLDFIRKRYNEVLPKFYNLVTGPLKESVKDSIIKIRNAFINCNFSSCLSHYLHIVQLIDLKLSEEFPFIILDNSSSLEEVHYELNLVMMREFVAANSLNIKIAINPGPEVLLSEQREKSKM